MRDHYLSLIGSKIVQPAEIVGDFGVLLDSELTLKQYITNVAGSCFHLLRRARDELCHHCFRGATSERMEGEKSCIVKMHQYSIPQ
jgi:hypothetical protein